MPDPKTSIVVTEDHGQPTTSTRCRGCQKPIIWPGRCYTCATGLPRRLVRLAPAQVLVEPEQPPHKSVGPLQGSTG